MEENSRRNKTASRGVLKINLRYQKRHLSSEVRDRVTVMGLKGEMSVRGYKGEKIRIYSWQLLIFSETHDMTAKESGGPKWALRL